MAKGKEPIPQQATLTEKDGRISSVWFQWLYGVFNRIFGDIDGLNQGRQL